MPDGIFVFRCSMALADNVRIFPGQTEEPFDATMLLEAAAREKLTDVVILGWDENGELFFSASAADGPEILWLIEKAKLLILAGPPDE